MTQLEQLLFSLVIAVPSGVCGFYLRGLLARLDRPLSSHEAARLVTGQDMDGWCG